MKRMPSARVRRSGLRLCTADTYNPVLMISVAALRMQQFGVQFYQASLTAKDIDKLVRFEVLNYGEHGQTPGVRGAAKQSKVHWDLLERRIAATDKAYQRHIIRKKIEELVQYYEQ